MEVRIANLLLLNFRFKYDLLRITENCSLFSGILKTYIDNTVAEEQCESFNMFLFAVEVNNLLDRCCIYL